MPFAAQVCAVRGCPELRPCRTHPDRLSSRNHRGVRRQARGLGVEHDRARRELARVNVGCELRLPGCTGRATSPEHRTPRSRGGSATPDGAACAHCQSVQGGRLRHAVPV